MDQGVKSLRWIKIRQDHPLPGGRVESVTCRQYVVCFGRYKLLNDLTRLPCPHLQPHRGSGNNLNQAWLRCPWHGWELLPLYLSSKPDSPAYRVEFRHDGVFVALRDPSSTAA